jgi:hypothetical protein
MKEIKKPDLAGPRFRTKRISILKAKTLKDLKKKYPEYSSLSLTEFKNIIMTFNAKIAESVINNRNGVELPDGLGFIFMGTCPAAKKKNVDFKKSIDFGVEASFRNWDSDNKLLKIFYTNRNSKHPFENKQVWSFKAVKQFRHDASVAFKDNWTKYIEVSPDQKISAMFDRHRKKEFARNLKPVVPEGYDEFKM